MGKEKEPFSLYKRKSSPYWYVQFKDESQGTYLSAKSTGELDKTKAIEIAWKWQINGIPEKGKDKPKKLDDMKLLNALKTADLDSSDLQITVGVLEKYGYIVISPDAKASREFVEYLLEFWDFEKSDYIKDKQRKKHSIGKNYCRNRISNILKYWKPYFEQRSIGEIMQDDIDEFIDWLDKQQSNRKQGLSGRTKNHIVDAGITALRWAVKKRIVKNDITQGITYFADDCKERKILTRQQVKSLFEVMWSDDVAKTANMLAFNLGMRAGEIQALKIKNVDFENNRIFVNHSWDAVVGLKSTKTNENRTIHGILPQVMGALRNLIEKNPYGQEPENFIFYSEICSEQPIGRRVFLKKLRQTLVSTGMSEEESKEYCVHGWRHYYNTYLDGRLDDKLIMSQTGHKTKKMKEHYSKHKTPEDQEKIIQVQQDVFGCLLPEKSMEYDNSIPICRATN